MGLSTKKPPDGGWIALDVRHNLAERPHPGRLSRLYPAGNPLTPDSGARSGREQKKDIGERAPRCRCCVALERFELSQAEPESDVLPLHHKALFCSNGCKGMEFW